MLTESSKHQSKLSKLNQKLRTYLLANVLNVNQNCEYEIKVLDVNHIKYVNIIRTHPMSNSALKYQLKIWKWQVLTESTKHQTKLSKLNQKFLAYLLVDVLNVNHVNYQIKLFQDSKLWRYLAIRTWHWKARNKIFLEKKNIRQRLCIYLKARNKGS